MKICYEVGQMKLKKNAAGALKNLAFEHPENQTKIVEANALPGLITLLTPPDS